MLAHAVDYGPAALWITWLRHCRLRASPCGLRGFASVDYASLWISQHSVLGRICLGLLALWISQHFVLGRICPLAGSLWITGLTAL